MKKVPFVKNHPDNMHCVNAVMRMIHQYFLGKDLSWREIDKLTKAIPGKGTWTLFAEMYFKKKGLEVINIEPLSYRSLYKQGVSYLKKKFGKQTAEYYLKKTNVVSVLKYIPEYLRTVKHETRRASIKEIIKFLRKGSLIGVEVNSRILNKKPGFSLHFVLLYDFNGKNIILHDPGSPPIKARKITIKEFNECFKFTGANGGITVFGKKRT